MANLNFRSASLILVVTLMALPFDVGAQGRPAGVITDTVEVEQISETVPIFGEIVAGRESRVASRISGVSDSVAVSVGDVVVAGEVLVEIDTELLNIQLESAQAEFEVAQAAALTARTQVANAQTAYDRASNLRAQSIIADAAYEERQSALAVAKGASAEAEARVAASRVALRRAEYDLENASVRAPFDGVVVEVGTEVGQFVMSGAEVVRLLDTDGMEVEANVPARYVGALQPDADVRGLTDTGGQMVLRLRAALPTEFAATRTRPVLFTVFSRDGDIATGQSVTLELPVSAPRDVIAVPKDALIQARGGWQVFVAQDGKALPREVEIGTALGDRYEVVSGLAPGDVVVIRGNERLRPGQDIAPQPVGAGAAGAPGGPQAEGRDEGALPRQTATREQG